MGQLLAENNFTNKKRKEKKKKIRLGCQCKSRKGKLEFKGETMGSNWRENGEGEEEGRLD